RPGAALHALPQVAAAGAVADRQAALLLQGPVAEGGAAEPARPVDGRRGPAARASARRPARASARRPARASARRPAPASAWPPARAARLGYPTLPPPAAPPGLVFCGSPRPFTMVGRLPISPGTG